MNNMYFGVYHHNLIYQDDRLVEKNNIVLYDNDSIVCFTDYHLLLYHKGKITAFKETNNKALYLCMLLNYVFFDKYHIVSLTELKVDMIESFINDYGMGKIGKETKSRISVEKCIEITMNFLINLIDYYKNRIPLKKEDLFKKEDYFNHKTRRYETRLIPVFNVFYQDNYKSIFRDIPDVVFSLLLTIVIEKHTDILMLVALGAFAGLRPSEACNVRRVDSVIGPGLRFKFVNNELQDVEIDLTNEYNLRNDVKPVGRIKKERNQRVYHSFLNAFYNCYQIYMDYMSDKKYEVPYAPLTVGKDGRAMTYDCYRMKFKRMVKNDLIPALYASNDSVCIIYANMLQEHNISPHILRHWYSTQLALHNEDVSGIMYWRGDKVPESALTYLQNKGDLDRKFKQVNSEQMDFLMWKAGKTYND